MQQQSIAYVERLKQFQTQLPQPTPEQKLHQTLHQLEMQAHHINQLATTQEAAIHQLKTIAQQVERRWKVMQLVSASHLESKITEADLEIPLICEYRAVAVPYIEKTKEGIWILASRSVDLCQAEREAISTAEELRHRAAKENVSKDKSSSPLLSAKPRTKSSRINRSPLYSKFTWREAMTLAIGGILIRLIIELVLASFPMLWAPAIVLIVAPILVTVYYFSTPQQTMWNFAYRLLFILIGLVIGGRV
ncbi:MAG: hypothetical protein HC769_11930 [Cyanobacteria bacterium CRU_2_1]|nr:hypothetical protein [Cyanobacteria bacterium CRU_2_1]